MSDLDALLAGIVAHPHEHVRWLIVADWLDDHGFAERAELLRLHRMLIDTCCEPDQHPERAAWQARIVELIDQGVTPCVPQHTLLLPGGVPLVGNFIPPGSFLMGDPRYDDEKPVHRVTLTRGFFLGVSPVTQGQWRPVMGEKESRFRGDELPMDSVNWNAAVDFCNLATRLLATRVQLPTEAEWEYACRAGTTTDFHWGDLPDAARMNVSGEEEGASRETTTTAGTFPSNPWGLADLHGNVQEWCSDSFDLEFYGRCPAENPECRDGDPMRRVQRGGSWFHFPQVARAARRGGSAIFRSFNYDGFRVAFTLG